MKKFVKSAANYLGLDRRSPRYLRRQYPEATPQDIELIVSLLPYTRTPPARLWALLQSVRYVVKRRIAGDFIECGTWRGGSSMAAAIALKRAGDTTRTLWLYDTYEGMPRPTKHDVLVKDGSAAIDAWTRLQKGLDASSWMAVDLDEVRSNMASTGYPVDKMRFVKGKVEETLPVAGNVPEQISILRLDTDWYSSTKIELELLLPRVVSGGVVILDDYGDWAGSKEAVDEFFANSELSYLLNRVDKACRLFIKA